MQAWCLSHESVAKALQDAAETEFVEALPNRDEVFAKITGQSGSSSDSNSWSTLPSEFWWDPVTVAQHLRCPLIIAASDVIEATGKVKETDAFVDLTHCDVGNPSPWALLHCARMPKNYNPSTSRRGNAAGHVFLLRAPVLA